MKRIAALGSLVLLLVISSHALAHVGTPPIELCGDPDDALAGVYNPDRLQIVQACAYITGTVTKIRCEADGDLHVNILPDPPFADVVNDKNIEHQDGALVVEPIPFDIPDLPDPMVGQHVMVIGSYVVDTHHGWMEIHRALLPFPREPLP